VASEPKIEDVVAIDELRSRLKRLMPGLAQPDPAEDERRGAPEEFATTKPDGFPVPGLVLFVLRNVLGLAVDGPFEKVRWSIWFRYAGKPFAVELRKFGLTLVHPRRGDDATAREVIGKLQKAVRETEPYLETFARRQAEDGRVTVQNQFARFAGMHRFLRQEATAAYARPEPPPVVETFANGQSGTTDSWGESERNGGYLGVAMTNAFFSWMEHAFLLVLPFTDRRLANEGLLKFMGAQWGEKFKVLFELTTDRDAKVHYDRLKQIRETIRNPASHGGVQAGSGSLHFHMPGIGAIPARMTRRAGEPHLVFGMLASKPFKEICDAFDSFVSFMEERFPLAWEYGESGLNVAFDAESRAEYRAATSSKEAFAQFLDRESYRDMVHSNMDY